MRLRCAASRGDISRSIASMASLVWAPASAWNTAETCASARPLRSSAAMVLAKLGRLGVARNGLDLRQLLGHGAVEGGAEMLRADRREGRRLARPGPGTEQRIGTVRCCVLGG